MQMVNFSATIKNELASPPIAMRADKSPLRTLTTQTKRSARRTFEPEFKLKVLKAYRYDEECRNNQRATARKYGVHRRQIQKWIGQEKRFQDIVSRNLRIKMIKETESFPNFNFNNLNSNNTAKFGFSDNCNDCNNNEDRKTNIEPIKVPEKHMNTSFSASQQKHSIRTIISSTINKPKLEDDPIDLSIKKPKVEPEDTKQQLHQPVAKRTDKEPEAAAAAVTETSTFLKRPLPVYLSADRTPPFYYFPTIANNYSYPLTLSPPFSSSSSSSSSLSSSSSSSSCSSSSSSPPMTSNNASSSFHQSMSSALVTAAPTTPFYYMPSIPLAMKPPTAEAAVAALAPFSYYYYSHQYQTHVAAATAAAAAAEYLYSYDPLNLSLFPSPSSSSSPAIAALPIASNTSGNFLSAMPSPYSMTPIPAVTAASTAATTTATSAPATANETPGMAIKFGMQVLLSS